MKALGYITLAEAEKVSGIKADTLKKRCQEGQIPGAVKQGKTWFVPRDQIVKDFSSPLDDKLLSILTTIAEAGIGTSITLFVGGMIISGDLIPIKEYVNGLRNSLAHSPQQEPVPEYIYGLFNNIFTAMEEGAPKNTTEVLEKQISALHLKNVAYKTGEVWTKSKDSFLRIKLNAIDGFMWGRENSAPLI